MLESNNTVSVIDNTVEKSEWHSLPSEFKQQWLGGNYLLHEDRDLWQKHASQVFEDVVHYSQSLSDNKGFCDFTTILAEFLRATNRKRQLAYAYEYKEKLLLQAKKANVHPDPVEYEYACENIGYEIGFLCGCISATEMRPSDVCEHGTAKDTPSISPTES